MFSDRAADGSGMDYDERDDQEYDDDMSGSGHMRKSILILSFIIFLISFLYLFNLLISLLDFFCLIKIFFHQFIEFNLIIFFLFVFLATIEDVPTVSGEAPEITPGEPKASAGSRISFVSSFVLLAAIIVISFKQC